MNFLLLHISDLHFGDGGRASGEDPVATARRCFKAIDSARTSMGWEEVVAVMVVTGDIANAARRIEYTTATAFLSALRGHLGLPAQRVVLLPGNHDISWHKCKILDEQHDCGDITAEERDSRLPTEKLSHFDDFAREFYGKPLSAIGSKRLAGHYAWIHSFPELDLDIAALDTCEKETASTHIGSLSPEQLQSLIDAWPPGQGSRVRIIALHHNPVAAPPPALESWKTWLRDHGPLSPDAFERLASDLVGLQGNDQLRLAANECQAQIALHGHQHVSRADEAWNWRRGTTPGQTHVIAAGSWGARPGHLPPDEPSAMQLLRISPAEKTISLVSLRFEPRAILPGEASPGAFVVDDTGRGAPLSLFMPPQAPPQEARATSQSAFDDFVKSLRAHCLSRFIRLDLRGIGAVQGGGSGAPVAPALDDVYVTLKFDRRPNSPKPSITLDTKGLLAQFRNKETRQRRTRSSASPPLRGLVLVGPAGAGKTTWMRWTFRRLAQSADIIPFMIELREFARHCDDEKTEPAKRNFSSFFEHVLESTGLQGWRNALESVFSSDTAPRPLLFVDGWDELGDLGDRTREQLVAFVNAHPRIWTIVTSRPYGQSRPAQVEGFKELYLQPLSDADIAELVRKFHSSVNLHRDAADSLVVAVEQFEEALRNSPDARRLARTPLLLTMMLFIGRDRPLPDRRHRLYDACLDAMLAARPDMKRLEGARLTSTQWCPADTVLRRHAAARLAIGIQRSTPTGAMTERVAIVVSRAEALALLPAEWSPSERLGFLEWLIGAAGVLVDRTDDSLSFTHLSFQEYLAAWHLKSTSDGAAARLGVCEDNQHSPTWWETLRLFAATISDTNPSWFDEMAQHLMRSRTGYWLLGTMLADGSGTDSGSFAPWQRLLPYSFLAGTSLLALECRRAWTISQQFQRRNKVIDDNWSKEVPWYSASLASTFLRDRDDHSLQWLMKSRDTEIRGARGDARRIGRGRVFDWIALDPLNFGDEIAALRYWPSRRTSLSRLLQMFAFASSAPNVSTLLADIVKRVSTEYSKGPPSASGDAFRRGALPFSRNATGDAFDHIRVFGPPLHIIAESAVDILGLTTRQPSLLGSNRHGLLEMIIMESEMRASTIRDSDEPDREPSSWNTWLAPQHLSAHSSDFARGALLTILACEFLATYYTAFSSPEGRNRVYLHRPVLPLRDGFDISDFVAHRRRNSYRGTPMWSAYARLLSGRPLASDLELLTESVSAISEGPTALGGAMRYIVQGDVILQDGTELTLDSIFDQAGVPRLPLIELERVAVPLRI